MTPVYSAANVTDAHLAKGVLEQSGIAAYVRGEHLQGGLGEIPVTGLIDVCVDAADEARARDVLARWKRGEFALEEDAPEAPAIPAVAGRWWTSSLLAFCIGVAIGGCALWMILRGPVQTHIVDRNDDGAVDERIFYSGERLLRTETDRNHDGRVDAIAYFDENMLAERASRDDDFDGRMETNERYLHGEWTETQSDRDADGAVDYRIDANAGVISREQWLDPEGRVRKQIGYRKGRAITSELDTDGDGVFDTSRALDAIAEPRAGAAP